ncbi:MAG: glycosyltransferase [Acidobacteria bacterium]|nr:MAG: glycosyltransferase [Acidobacteriota bacterium]
MIGPSHPFRGGLALHTTLLYRHLRRDHQVSFYGFKRQYPGWLFPGKTDRDNSKKPLTEPGIEYLLDSLNPWTWVRVVRRILADRPDLVIIPWWTFYWTPQFLTITALLKLLSKSRLLFICHNVFDHDSRFLSRFCAKTVLPRGDYFIVHSEEDRVRLSAIVPQQKITLGFLTGNECPENGTLSREEARRRLDLTGDLLLFFGFVRPYKGVEYLLQALPLILRERQVTLLLVGESWDGDKSINKHVEELSLERHIKRIDGYVPNEEVGLYFSAADLVILPYVSATGSGVVQSAFTFDRPVVASRVGSLPQTVDDGRTGYLIDPADPRALADAVLRFFREEKSREFIANIKLEKAKFGWERFVQLVEQTVTPEEQPLKGPHGPQGQQGRRESVFGGP